MKLQSKITIFAVVHFRLTTYSAEGKQNALSRSAKSAFLLVQMNVVEVS